MRSIHQLITSKLPGNPAILVQEPAGAPLRGVLLAHMGGLVFSLGCPPAAGAGQTPGPPLTLIIIAGNLCIIVLRKGLAVRPL